MTDEQESKGTQPDVDRTLEDDVKMRILAAAQAARGRRPGPDTEPDEQELRTGQVPLDINTAAVHQLANIPGIGPALARAIVGYRDQEGPFHEASDLAAVPGMSREGYEHLADRIVVEPVEGDRPLIIGYDERPAGEDTPWDASQGPGPG